MLAELARRLLMLFRRIQFDRDLEEEMRLHRELREQEHIERGLSSKEAHYAALRRFGNAFVLREESHDMWGWNWLETLLHDVRYGLRQLRRNPGFTAAAVITLAMGIGTTTALFTVVHSVLLEPLPFKDSGRLVRLYEHSSDDKFPYNNNAAGVFAEWKKQSHGFSDLALVGGGQYNLSSAGGQLAEEVNGSECSWNLFPTLGVEPALGRTFTAAEDRPSATATVVLSWGLWKRRFGGIPLSSAGASILMQSPTWCWGLCRQGLPIRTIPPNCGPRFITRGRLRRWRRLILMISPPSGG